MSRYAKWLLAGSLLGFLIIVYFLGSTLTPFFTAAILAYLFDPLVSLLQRARIPRTIAVIVVFTLIIALVSLILLFIIPIVEYQVILFIQNIPDMIAWTKQMINSYLVKFGHNQLSEQVVTASQQGLKKASGFATQLLHTVTSSVVPVFSLLTNLFLIPVVLFYLLRDWHPVLSGVRNLIPRSALPTVNKLLNECNEVVSAFLRGQLLVMLALAVLYATGLSIIGLNLAVIIGIISGLASIVPYLGFIIGIVTASLAAFFQFQDFWYVFYVAIVFLIANGIEGSILTPWLVGDKIGLHPVAVIFAILIGGQLFGFVGVLLALPVAAVIMVFIRHLIVQYKQSLLYDAPQPPTGV